MSFRQYEPGVQFKCRSCEGKLEGTVYRDDMQGGVWHVLAEPCQRCLQCAEADIENLKQELMLLAERLNNTRATIDQLNKDKYELNLRIEQMYVERDARRYMSMKG